MADRLDRIRNTVRTVPDFPKPGILFRDITPVLANPRTFADTIGMLAEHCNAPRPPPAVAGAGRGGDERIEQVVAIESRGFIFGAALAYALGAGLTIVRKPGKLPAATLSESYSLEYGSDTLQLHADALKRGQRCVLVDDLLATGGTAAAAARLVERAGATVVECLFVIELTALGGRAKLGWPVHSLLTY